ncbi:MAG TPA: redox-regulated ATPase YchF [Candidatus Binatia bacterium]|jgi:GTP-binding protein YchF|nr:redox-regulated ATPase YchF [Candidatus Binatia bacterium]
MKLGIIGLPGAGKTTILNALTGGNAPTGRSVAGRFDVLTAVVDVPDPRVDALAELFEPRKVTYAKVTYTDVAGLDKGIGESGALSGALVNHLGSLDGFLHVVRAFENELAPHREGSVDPLRDLYALDAELLISDLIVVETRIERLQTSLQKSALKDKASAQTELALFGRLQNALTDEVPLRHLKLSDEERRMLRGYGFLTLKPVLVVFNIGDEQDEIDVTYPQENSVLVNLRGKLEEELAQLEGEDLALFMAEYGVEERGLSRIIALSYDLLGLQSFFTVGEDEVRAWTIERGATALDAAATIHTDLARGFIRAEVVPYDELLASGSLAAARAAGKLRLEGKLYMVQDGDIVHVKFNL